MNEKLENYSQTREEAKLVFDVQVAEEELRQFYEMPKPDLESIRLEILKERQKYCLDINAEGKKKILDMEKDYLDAKMQYLAFEKREKTLEGNLILAKQRLERFRQNR